MVSFQNGLATIGLALLCLLLAGKPADAYYTGACIKMPVRHTKGVTQYHLRIPHGQGYNHHLEDFPGETFYDALESCHVQDFTTTYDIDGNAHVDFKVPARKWKNMAANKCDVAAKIELATRREHTPNCVDGTPSTLADQWRHSWVD